MIRENKIRKNDEIAPPLAMVQLIALQLSGHIPIPDKVY